MSAHTRKRHTDKVAAFDWHGAHYAVPVRLINKYKVSDDSVDAPSIDDVFSDLVSKSGEPGVLLRGLRTKEGLTQVEFAKKIGVTQANLSGMENGRRIIGKDIAKRLSEQFKVDYRLFL